MISTASSPAQHPLVAKLVERQHNSDEPLSDRAFARKLGIGHTLWCDTKRGDKQPTLVLLAAALATYPDLAEVAVEYLRDRGEAQRTRKLAA